MNLEPITRLTRDIKQSAKVLGDAEARFLVDAYYSMQENRIRSGNQVRALTESNEPNDVIRWLMDNDHVLERNIAAALDAYSNSKREGRWARSQIGIGPVIAAGLLAHIDVRIGVTAGKVWRFAGLDPTVKWEKGQKRPWNARLKVLCWKMGESFKKTSNHPETIYGRIYRERKAQEVLRNAEGRFAEQAKAKLQTCKIIDIATRTKYEIGQLPDGRLDLRAMRYAVKQFLSHYQAVAYECVHGTKPPKPWVIEHGGHVDYVAPPGWPSE